MPAARVALAQRASPTLAGVDSFIPQDSVRQCALTAYPSTTAARILLHRSPKSERLRRLGRPLRTGQKARAAL